MPRRFSGLDRTGHLNRTTKQQQFFGQSRLPGIRMADDAECPAAMYLFKIVSTHVTSSLLLPIAGETECGPTMADRKTGFD
jgi:hypothetical protein